MFRYKKADQDKIKENCKKLATHCKKLKTLIEEDDCPVADALKSTSELMSSKKKEPKVEKLDGNEEVVLNQEPFINWRTYDIIH